MEKLKRPEIIFAIFALVFGTIIMFITPKYEVPDEMAHFNRAKEVSNGILYNNLPQNRHDNYKFHGASGYSPVMYISSAIGYKIGTYTKNNEITFYLGRFFNLITWIILIFFAIKITPIFKWQFLFVSLFPMSIQQGMSYSADSFNNAFAFLFFAYIFKIVYENKDFSIKKNYIAILFMSLIGSFCKGIIYPACLIFTKDISKQKKLLILFTILLSITALLYWKTNNYTAEYPGVIASQNRQVLLNQPIFFLKQVFLTSIHYLPNWLGQLIGKLGVSKIKLNSIIYFFTAIFFTTSFIFIPEKYTIKLSQKLLALILFIIYFISTIALMFTTWTPLGSQYIQGIQGRYFLTVMPLIFLLFASTNFKKFKEKSNIFLILLIFYIFIMLSYTVILLINKFYL